MALIDEDGFMHGKKQGLYFMDTKFVGKAIPEISTAPTFLGIKEKNNDSVSFWFMSKVRPNDIEESVLYILRYSVDGENLKLNLDFFNYSNAPIDFVISFVIDYTFNDIFEIRGNRYPKKRFYVNDFVDGQRAVYETEEFKCVLDLKGKTSEKFHLGSHEGKKMELVFTPRVVFKKKTVGTEVFGNLSHERPHLEVPCVSGRIGKLLASSTKDLEMLLLDTKYGVFPAAGLPWFSTIFGRDSLIFTIQAMEVYPEIARSIFRILAATQSKISDDFTDAEPGKIIHEIRVDEMSLSEEIPFKAYYGSIDATPLYLMAMRRYSKLFGRGIYEELSESIGLAANYIEKTVNERGYLSYSSKSGKGLSNQGWKDSFNSSVFKNGEKAKPPIALVEVQGYLYEAYLMLSEFYKGKRSEEYLERARKLKKNFNEDFWMKDEKFFALAIDGNGKQVNSVTSNPGHCLMTGIIDDERVKFVVDRLLKSDMFTGWGVRTMASSMGAYSPISYHNGTVWPHDNSILMLGAFERGFVAEAKKLAFAMLDAAEYFGWRLPELFGGNPRSDGSIIPYPLACSPQLWSIGAGFVITKILRRD